MKRSINIENIAVVMALGIALSLLATACGPSKLKTIKNSKFTFVEKQTQESNILKAAKEKRMSDLDVGPQAPVNSVAVQDLAKRLLFVSLRELSETTANLTIQVKTANGTPYYITFIEPHVDLDIQGKKTITFAKNIARKVLSPSEVSKTAEALPFSAQIKVIDKGQAIVSIYEKNEKSTTEVAAMVRLNNAVAALNFSNTDLDKLKDATYKVRMTQLYISNDNVLQGDINYLDSNSNRVVITVDSKEIDQKTNKPKELVSLNSKIDPNSNSTALKITNVDESLKGVLNAKTTATLTSGDAVIKSDILAISISQADSKNTNSITLTLVNKPEQTKEEVASSDSTSDDATQPTAEQIKIAENRQYDTATRPVADFSNVIENVTTTKKITDLAPVIVTAPAMKVTDLEPVIVTGTVPKKNTATSIIDKASEAMTAISDLYKKANDKAVQDKPKSTAATVTAPN